MSWMKGLNFHTQKRKDDRLKIVESPLFRARRNHLSWEEQEYLDQEIDKICNNPSIGIARPKIRDDMYTHLYEDNSGKKILSYRYLPSKIRLVSIDRITLKV